MIPGDVILFLSLLTAHLVSDFLMQTDADVKFKRHPWRLAKHVAIVTAMSYLLAGAWTAWMIPLVIAVTHAIIDRLKLLAEDQGWQGRVPFLADQAAHVGVVAGLAFGLYSAETAPAVFWYGQAGTLFLQACVLASGAIVAINFGGYFIGMSIEPYLREVITEAKRQTGASSERLLTEPPSAEGLAKGGMIIGQLERALIYFFVLTGFAPAIGFLVAAKSVFRWGELSRSRKEAEYILIGTLMSFGWSLVVAWFTGWAGRQIGLW